MDKTIAPAAIQPQQRSPAPQRQQQQQNPGRAQHRFTSGLNRGWQQEASTERQDRPLPELSAEVAGQPFLIVVEGINDLRAVRRAVPTADVYVLGSSSAVNKPKVLKELQAATRHYPRGLLLFLDPDVAGRQGRQLLEASLPGCLHAFVPSPLATADRATKYHDIGNVGVEHASPAAIRAALAAPRASNPQRQEFTRDHLLRCGLVAELHARGGNVTARRKLIGAYLGLGECDGKQLMRQLNLYGFTKQEVNRALAWAEPRLPPPGPTVPPQQSKLAL